LGVDDGVVLDEAVDRFQVFRPVDDGIGVGHRDDRRDAAGRRRLGDSGPVLAELVARRTGVDVTVHDARDQQVAVGVVYLVRLRQGIYVADGDDLTVVHRDRGFRRERAVRCDDSGVTYE
jgi:hypothetical protein